MAGVAHTTVMLAVTVLTVSFVFQLFGADAMRSMKKKNDKHDYNFEIRSVETLPMSPEYFDEDSSLSYSLYNETQMTINANVNLKKDVPTDMMLSIVAITKDAMTNQWMEKVRHTTTLCDFIENSTYFMDKFCQESNFPRKCPLTKGSYYIKNAIIDNSEFPKHLDEAEWRGDVKVFEKGSFTNLLAFTVYADVETIDDE